MTAATSAWVSPGLRWGLQPRRRADEAAWYAPWSKRAWRALQGVVSPAELRREQAAATRRRQAAWAALPAADEAAARRHLRARMASQALSDELLTDALGCVAAAAARSLDRLAFDSQLLCAQALLQERLVEMATGEGKTLAVALAACTAALAGTPVHVLTANDYLAERDAQALQPLCAALGLSVGVVLAVSTPQQRRAAYACHITYATARELAFDHLRDGLRLRQSLGPHGEAASGELARRARAFAGDAGDAPLLRGLCCAFIDEADSLLIDEAVMPLVLSEPQEDDQQRAACFQALALARQLVLGQDALMDSTSLAVHWTASGLQRLEALAQGLGGAWLNRRHRQDLCAQALVALHGLQAQRDYLVQEGRVELLDRISGRRATGRVWQRGLQTLVELKEGCKPSPATRTAAQTSYQRFFAQYHRLAGTSGTLAECRAELAAVYGRSVVRVPLRLAGLRRLDRPEVFVDGARREAAAVQRIRELHAQGRPVLVGVASVAASQSLAQRLTDAAIPHRVLDARHESQEAAIVAAAGQAGAVTVATAMAGRGTDIVLGEGVAARGGLHVLNLMDSACARSERQLIGRAARQGDPGSAQTWHAADAPRWREGRWPGLSNGTPQWTLQATSRLQQLAHGWHTRQQRRRILEQDLVWENQLAFRTQHA